MTTESMRVGREKLPEYWSRAADGAGRTVLSHAVRGGKAMPLLTGLGIVCLGGALWGAYGLVAGGDLTIAGWILVLLVPGGVAAFGAHCLNIVFLARTDYLLGGHGLIARNFSLWGSGQADEIPRASVVAVTQRYTPPGESSPTGAPGTWTTFLVWQGKNGHRDEFALAGIGSAAEARWLGPMLAAWAGVPLKRGYGEGLDEADPEELPGLDT